MTKRYMKGVEFSEEQLRQLRKSLKAMLFIFIIHTALIVYSAFYMSKKEWGFISGGLFYIIFALYFAVEIIRKRVKAKKYNQ